MDRQTALVVFVLQRCSFSFAIGRKGERTIPMWSFPPSLLCPGPEFASGAKTEKKNNILARNTNAFDVRACEHRNGTAKTRMKSWMDQKQADANVEEARKGYQAVLGKKFGADEVDQIFKKVYVIV